MNEYKSSNILLKESINDPLRIISLFLTWFVLCYGARIGNDSPLTYYPLENFFGQLNPNHIAIISALIFTFISRSLTKNYEIEKPPFHKQNVILWVIMVMYPLISMFIIENRFRIPYEITGMPVFLLMFYVWSFIFKPSDLKIMAWILFFSGLYKSIEGMSVFFTIGIKWGLLTGWRDALLQSIMISGAVFAFVVKPKDDREYSYLRYAFFISLPMTLFTFINSIRRSFMLSILISMILLMFTLPKREVKRILSIITLILIGSAFVAVTFINPKDLELRITNLTDPSTEGSTAYRLIEVYNVWQMVKEKPLTGYPMGTQSKNYTNITFENVSSLMPHNTYLYMLYRAGICGLIAWLFFLIVIVKLHLQSIKAANSPFLRFLALWFASATLALIPAGFVIPTQSDKLEFLFPFVLICTSYLPRLITSLKTEPLYML